MRLQASQRAQVVELTIPSKPEYVSVVRLAVAGVASRLPFGYDVVEDIKLAVSEACNNAIEHGRPLGVPPDEAKVVVRCFVTNSELVIEVVDQGPGFDPAEVEEKMGLRIIRSMMDEVQFLRLPEGGMVVRLTKKVAQA